MYINTLKLIAMLVKLKALKHVICTGSGSMYARQSGREVECELSETLSGDMNMDKIHTVFIPTLPKTDSLFTLVTH